MCDICGQYIPNFVQGLAAQQPLAMEEVYPKYLMNYNGPMRTDYYPHQPPVLKPKLWEDGWFEPAAEWEKMP